MVGPHVVRVGQAEVIVEPVLHGKELLEVPEVPFPVAGGSVSLLLADLGDRDLLRVNADCGLGTEGTQDAHPYVVAAREQPGPRGRAHGLRHVEVGEFPAFLGHAVEVRGGVALGPEGPDVGVSHIVHEHDDDVGRSFGPQSERQKKEKKICKSDLHGVCLGCGFG